MNRRISVSLAAAAAVVLTASGPLGRAALAGPGAGGFAGLKPYTMGHAGNASPSDLLGGPLTVEVTQKNGSTRFVLPGPRGLDPAIFGTPKQPAGFEATAPFPLTGVPLDLRLQAGGAYTITGRATPFSNWREVGVGSVHMKLVDATAIDGSRTRDKVDFEAEFKLPDGVSYKVVCKKPLPHGMAFPTFGGVATNVLVHGNTGVGTRLMPTEFMYAGFWGIGDIYRDGKLVNEGHLIHAMLTEAVRGDSYRLDFDGAVGNPPTTRTLHLMIPPFKPVPGKGLVPDPLKTKFMPFPFVKKHMMATMKKVKGMPDGPKKQHMMAMLDQTKTVMEHTKKHVMEATKAGKMFGMPFVHIMFGNLKIKASR